MPGLHIFCVLTQEMVMNGLPKASFIRAPIPFMKLLPSGPDHLPKDHCLLMPPLSGLVFQNTYGGGSLQTFRTQFIFHLSLSLSLSSSSLFSKFLLHNFSQLSMTIRLCLGSCSKVPVKVMSKGTGSAHIITFPSLRNHCPVPLGVQ